MEPDIGTELFGVRYSLPVGIAPVGLTGLIWPGADVALAETAARCRHPLCGQHGKHRRRLRGGASCRGHGLVPALPSERHRRPEDLLHRAQQAGFTVLVVTADVPARARRERQTRERVSMPPRITPRHVSQAALRPAWTLGLLRTGLPRFHTLEPYVDR
ncbi:(S)-mandelate dehydrogenase [Geodia barretti]|uniref:(S)-mandelate dehydrogenase n=1 Tax=Geodia barretti TaxID=519541 RepID=A0AA35VXX6_GEOBA|nr:(S)-mandelate dehydrogenase [Geodia barretti]